MHFSESNKAQLWTIMVIDGTGLKFHILKFVQRLVRTSAAIAMARET